MQLRFEVLLEDVWVPATWGIILGDGRFSYATACGRDGIVPPPLYRQTEESFRQPEFRRRCWESLTPEEKEQAIARMGGAPSF